MFCMGDDSTVYYLSRRPTDLRKGFDSLCAEVRTGMGRDPSLPVKEDIIIPCGLPENAARDSAMIYSLLGTCRMCGHNPQQWLIDILRRINDCRTS